MLIRPAVGSCSLNWKFESQCAGGANLRANLACYQLCVWGIRLSMQIVSTVINTVTITITVMIITIISCSALGAGDAKLRAGVKHVIEYCLVSIWSLFGLYVAPDEKPQIKACDRESRPVCCEFYSYAFISDRAVPGRREQSEETRRCGLELTSYTSDCALSLRTGCA